MLLSLNWLKDYVKIPSQVSPEELGKLLTLRTVEVEKIIKQGEGLENVVIGKILELRKHPNAERLQLVKVDIGKRKLDIVCGAQNIKVGDFVPVAMIGAKLPNGLEIKAAEIRGEKSFGMLCAADELGLGKDHSGIYLLPDGKLGASLTEYLKLDDLVYEIDNKSLTNRPDLWGHTGMARDISAILNAQYKEYKLDKKIFKKNSAGKKLDIKVEDKIACPRYMAIRIENVSVKESPDWIKRRLNAVGLRAINNIVDATNYVMFDLGQPLHAFDASIIKEIRVRKARENEIIKTLDDQERKLTKEMLVIADKQKAIAIAGVMGGANSEINNETVSIIIEAANFEPTQVRKTSQKLSLRTESSMRFEKSLDPELCPLAMARAIEIIKETCPQAKINSELVDIAGPKSKEVKISVETEWLENILGEKVGTEKIISVLAHLGFKIKKTKNKIETIVPSWRATKDISIPEDIAEEVARIYGYDNLNPEMPEIRMEAPQKNLSRELERKIKTLLALGAGYSEVYNYSFVGNNQLKKLKITSPHLKIANPIANQLDLLRQSLTPNLLENLKNNQANFAEFGIFEIGDTYFEQEGNILKGGNSKGNLPLQKRMIGILFAGAKKDKAYFNLKGVIEFLFDKLNLKIEFEAVDKKSAYVSERVNIKLFNKKIGNINIIDQSIGRELGVKKEAAVAEIDFETLCELFYSKSELKYEEPAKFPPVIRDLAFVVKSDLLYNEIRSGIESSSPLIKNVELFDVYEGEKLGEGKKNLAFRIIYQDKNKTLSAEEVETEQKKIIEKLEKKFGAQIRNF